MARDHTARARIRQYLMTAGPVDDPSGYATKVLKDAIGYEGSSVAFIQLIAAMDADGEISREIRGKRTYTIAAAEAAESIRSGSSSPAPSAGAVRAGANGALAIDIDYDRLAKAIVREFFAAAAERQAVPAVAAVSVDSDVRAVEDKVAKQRDEYARRLDEARNQLDQLLTEAADFATR
ncbi:hypothetical protein [Williamsia muralis]|nr:hypothetical protein [Williamsia marianensis]